MFRRVSRALPQLRAAALAWFCLLTPMVQAAPNTQVHLLLSSDTARPGDTLLAALEFQMPEGWHIYWRNAGESGEAPEIHWNLPTGITAGKILWPTPEKRVDPPLTTYIYSGQVLLLVPLMVSSDLKPAPMPLRAKVRWLECGPLCLAAKAEVEAVVTVGPAPSPSRDAALIDAWQKRLPRKSPGFRVSASWTKPAPSGGRVLVVHAHRPVPVATADFYPDADSGVAIAGDSFFKPLADGFEIEKSVQASNGHWPTRVTGLLVWAERANGRRESAEVNLEMPED